MAIALQEKHVDQEVDQDPQVFEGLLSDEFEPYLYEDLDIVQITLKEVLPPDEYGNVLSRYRLEATDGSLRNINFCEPKERLTDIPVLETPALYTGSQGFNEDGQRMLGALGIPSILVGNPGEERDSWAKEIARVTLHPLKLAQELRNIHLARQAHVMVQVHKHINDWLVNTQPIETEKAFLVGKSRGAMTALWFLAYCNMLEEGPEVPFHFNVAACYKEAFNANSRSRSMSQLASEALHLGSIAARKLATISRHSLSTINLSPKAQIYELAHIPTLIRGDSGKALPFIDKRQVGFRMGFERDIAGQNDLWDEALVGFENIICRVVPGAHGSGIVDRRTAALVMRTFDVIVGQLQTGTPTNEIDISHLRQDIEDAIAA